MTRRQAAEVRRKLEEERASRRQQLQAIEGRSGYALAVERKRVEFEAELEARGERRPRPPSVAS
eukprot:4074652-Alexandrium_andersonii.AAC.1